MGMSGGSTRRDFVAMLLGAPFAYACSKGSPSRALPPGTLIVDETLRCREPEERVWYLGRWWDGLYLDAAASNEDRRQLAAFNAEIDRWSAWRDGQGRRAFAIPRSLATDDPAVTALDAQS